MGGKRAADEVERRENPSPSVSGRRRTPLQQCNSIILRHHTSYLRVFVSSFVFKHDASEPDTERKNKAAKV